MSYAGEPRCGEFIVVSDAIVTPASIAAHAYEKPGARVFAGGGRLSAAIAARETTPP